MNIRTLGLLALFPIASLAACGDKEDDPDTGDTDTEDTDTEDTDTEDTDTEDTGDTEDTDPDTDDTGDTDTDVVEDSVIKQIQKGEIAVGSAVTVEGAIATTDESSLGFFISDTDGGEYSGIYVYLGTDVEVGVSRGDELTINGTVLEYSSDDDTGADDSTTLSEIVVADASAVTVTGTGTAPDPVDVTVATLAADSEPYESVVISVASVTVTDPDAGFGEWVVDDTLYIDDLIYDFTDENNLKEGDTFGSITAPLYYSYGAYKLVPRDADDFVDYTPVPCSADKCPEDLVEGDLIVTEVMYNPDLCSDSDCEWIEVYNASGGSVNLDGLTIEDEGGSTGSIGSDAVIAAGDYAVLAASDGDGWGYTTVTPDGWWNVSGFLNQSGDIVYLKVDSTAKTIDATASWADDDDAPGAGISWQLDPSTMTPSGNDSASNWCASTSSIETDEYGTPGAANVACE